MKISDQWSKFGVTGLMFAAFFAGIWEEGRSEELSSVFFTIAMVLFGVLLTQVVVDWWESHHRDPDPDPQDINEDKDEDS